jgi:hypothetical protein
LSLLFFAKNEIKIRRSDEKIFADNFYTVACILDFMPDRHTSVER